MFLSIIYFENLNIIKVKGADKYLYDLEKLKTLSKFYIKKIFKVCPS